MRVLRRLMPFVCLPFLAFLIACAPQEAEPEAAAPAATETAPEAPDDEAAPAAEMTDGERANAEFEDAVSGQELLAALRAGGHVIYFRHAQTERDYADQADPNMSLDDCETQRKLSEAGMQDARDIGAAFEAKEIPIGRIVTSQYCRAWQTAELAFGRFDEQNPKLNFLPFEDYTEEQVAEMKANVTPLLTDVPATGANTMPWGSG